MSKMPDGPVRVLGKRYRLINNRAGVGGSRSMGETNHGALTIEVDGTHATGQLRDTLLHEVFHTVDFALHLDLEERQVHALACGLLCVMRDNPELMRWLLESDE